MLPDNWMGIYSGNAATAPTDWAQYQWFQIKGEKGDIGIPATLTRQTVEYQAGDSGTIIPSGAWSTSIPVVAQGKYLWTRTTLTYNTGDQVVSYYVSRFGLDGTGAVSSVAGVSPDPDGNVPLSASDVGALPSAGGDMTGPINMNGQTITGLNDPTADTDAARKAYVDSAVSIKTAALTASGWSESAPYTQTISVAGVVAEKPPHVAPVYSGNTDADIALKEACAAVTYATPGAGTITFVCLEDKPGVDIPIQVEVRR